MKKIILNTLVFMTIFISSNIVVFWGDSCAKCKIHEWTPDIINDYIKDLRTVIWNITQEINQAESTRSRSEIIISKETIRQLFTNVNRAVNRAFDFRWYVSYFNFYVTFPLFRENSTEIWRDYNLLKREREWLERYYKSISQKAWLKWSLDIDKVCRWVSHLETCKLLWKWSFVIDENSIQAFMLSIMTNHNAIMDYFRRSILYDNPESVLKSEIFKRAKILYENETFMLMPLDFKDEFAKFYNWMTNSDCLKCSWWFTQRIEKAFDDMDKRLADWIEWAIDNWIEATKLLMWTHENQSQIEQNLLKNELARQWVNSQKAQEMADNLDKPLMENNFFVNSYNNIKNNINSERQRWSTYYNQEFWWWFAVINHIWEWLQNTRDQLRDERNNQNNSSSTNSNQSQDSINILDIQKNINNIQRWSSISMRINTLYLINKQKADISSQDISLIENRLNNMYYNIDTISNNIESVTQTAVDVCNSQWRWLWICDYR